MTVKILPHVLSVTSMLSHVCYGTVAVRIMVRPDTCHLKMDKLIFSKGFYFFFKSTTIMLVCKGKIYSVEESSVPLHWNSRLWPFFKTCLIPVLSLSGYSLNIANMGSIR